MGHVGSFRPFQKALEVLQKASGESYHLSQEDARNAIRASSDICFSLPTNADSILAGLEQFGWLRSTGDGYDLLRSASDLRDDRISA